MSLRPSHGHVAAHVPGTIPLPVAQGLSKKVCNRIRDSRDLESCINCLCIRWRWQPLHSIGDRLCYKLAKMIGLMVVVGEGMVGPSCLSAVSISDADLAVVVVTTADSIVNDDNSKYHQVHSRYPARLKMHASKYPRALQPDMVVQPCASLASAAYLMACVRLTKHVPLCTTSFHILTAVGRLSMPTKLIITAHRLCVRLPSTPWRLLADFRCLASSLLHGLECPFPCSDPLRSGKGSERAGMGRTLRVVHPTACSNGFGC
jgi:hypothetical protein